ncbi:MAG: flagellar basal body rod protein FlgC [Gammaproteobacteria bacterium]|nr:flagellar basal body rod protein FlgC [Gammaproteobacteria bacterium]
MSLFKVFDIAGSGMSAQMLRLNTVSSNLANAQTYSTTEEGAYRSRQPVFQTVLNDLNNEDGSKVRVTQIVESDATVPMNYMPNHPLANEQGYVFGSNVNAVEEMTNMMSASRSYQNNTEMMNTSKELLLRTLQLGRG